LRQALFAGAVHRDEDADAVVGQQVQIGVEGDRVTAVPDDLMAVAVLVIEAQRHAVQRRHILLLRGMHLTGGGLLEDAHVAVLAVVQVRDHEAGHVVARGRKAAGRCGSHQFVGLGGTRSPQVARRHACQQVRLQRLAEARVVHAQRREDVVRDVLVERLA
jgi:hypothetical protein